MAFEMLYNKKLRLVVQKFITKAATMSSPVYSLIFGTFICGKAELLPLEIHYGYSKVSKNNPLSLMEEHI
jgi:hypothetical protein